MRVSVCLATYNGARYIKAQLESILVQVPPDAQVIIADNNSTDNTINIVNDCEDPRVEVYINKETKGPIANFGFALSHAIGDVIFLSDQDDVWADGKVKACLEQLRNADLVLSDCKITDGQLNVIHESFFQLNKSGKGLLKNLVKNSYIGCCMAFRKELLPLVLPFPRNIPMHDIWIGFVGELFYRTRFMEQKLVYYRRHEANASVTSAPSPFGIIRQLLFRFNVIRYFPLLIFRKMKSRKKNTRV